MHPVEIWWLIEANQPQKTYSGMTESEAEDCYQQLLVIREERQRVNNG